MSQYMNMNINIDEKLLDYLFKERNGELKKENEQLQTQVKSLETTMNATSDYNAYLQSEVKDLEKENEQLKRRLEKINGGYGHLTHRKGLTANEWLIDGQEKEIKRKDEQISEWIEQHSKDIVKIGEQNKLIRKLKEENKQLKRQLLYDGDDVCGICKHEYLTPKGDYFIKKCEKGHEECSKKDIKYCEDFELIQVDFEDLIKRMDKELKE